MSWLEKFYPSLLLAILAFAFFSRIILIHKPAGYVFDEVYHAVTAKLIAKNDPRAFEWWNPAPEPDTAVDWLHPPLAKYTQAAMIFLLGEYPFAWRLSSALFGVGVIWLTALLADELFENRRLSLFAALIASLDGLLLTMSRIAMNDIHVTFFILLAILMYAKHLRQAEKTGKSSSFLYSRYLLLTGLSAGLATGTKWSGIFSLAVIGITQLIIFIRFHFSGKGNGGPKIKNYFLPLLKNATALILVPAAVYLLSYSQMFLQGKDFNHFLELHRQTWHYQTHLDATHPYESRPYEWLLNLRPVWLAVDYISDSERSNIYAFGNPAVFWLGAVSLPAVIILLLTKKIKLQRKYLALLLAAYLIVWLPWQFSPRIMFFYHYTPAVPLLSIITALVLCKLIDVYGKIGKMIATAALLLMAVTFVIWYPHWTYIPMPVEFINQVYFALDGWK